MKRLRIEEFTLADLPQDTHQRFWLHALDVLTGPVLLPTIAVTGVSPGPTLFVVAGVHGDEYEGMAAIRRVVAQVDPSQMKGQIVAIPVVNPFAYEARARVAPLHIDGLNLARVFPGAGNGSPSQILAHQLLDLVLRNLGPDDLFFDFHSGSADVRLCPAHWLPGYSGRSDITSR